MLEQNLVLLVLLAFQLVLLHHRVATLWLALELIHLPAQVAAMVCFFLGRTCCRGIAVKRVLVAKHDGLAFLGVAGEGQGEKVSGTAGRFSWSHPVCSGIRT